MTDLQQRIAEKIANFKVGDTIEFQLYDASHCTEGNDDPTEITLTGTILSINDRTARVEHKYGIANASLVSAKLTGNKGIVLITDTGS